MLTIRPMLVILTLAGLSLGSIAARPAAAAPPSAPDLAEARDRALCARASASPLGLAKSVEQVSVEGRTPLAAWFALDGDQLTATVVTAGDLAASHDYREFAGPVSPAAWVPVERALREPAEVAQAARWQLLLFQIDLTLARGLLSSSTVRRGAGATMGALPLSLRPALLQRRPMFEGQVAVDGTPWSVSHNATTGIVYAGPPAYVLAREAEARKRVGRALPELTVAGGRWLNVETPPTLAGWKGEPVLALLTNFNCEMECGPAAATVSKWARVYGSRGLRVVTIYREREEWNPHVTLEDAIARVKQAKTVHPVLIDPDDQFIEGLEPGPIGYPVAYVVGADGLVAWEGVTSLLTFESACKQAIEDALTAAKGAPAQGAGLPAPGR